MDNVILGIDPGASGGFCLMNNQKMIKLCKFTDWHETNTEIENIKYNYPNVNAVIEKVHAMPGQGVTSMFSFGMNFGYWHGILVAHKIPFNYVSPQKWQKLVGNLPIEKADRKRALRDMAKNNYPEQEKLINLNTADAVWIAKTANTTEPEEPKYQEPIGTVFTASPYEKIQEVTLGDMVIVKNIQESNKIGNVAEINVNKKTVKVQLLVNKVWEGTLKNICWIKKNID